MHALGSFTGLLLVPTLDLAEPAWASSFQISPVVMVGDAAPGTGGGTYAGFVSTTLDFEIMVSLIESGEAVFYGEVAGGCSTRSEPKGRSPRIGNPFPCNSDDPRDRVR